MQILFYILFAFVPLVLWPYTSELFEFNKMILVYLLTTITATVWLIKMITSKKIIFRRTILDIPLLIFLATQFLSALFSIDPRTSWLGYYSRFNGGLTSSLCYSLLYWAFVSNMGRLETLSAIRYMLFSAGLVSVWGILEHFGIDKNLWVQDVQNRVFSTLGQPNWLATWLAALIPITWLMAKGKPLKSWIYLLLSGMMFTTLLFTKSRSGFLGFTVASLIYWTWAFATYKRKILKTFLTFNIIFLILILLTGFPINLIRRQSEQKVTGQTGPALETGGTESGTIRKIVWRGAVGVWAHYPIFGSGVETFAYSYYKFRPAEHNLVSEWDFLYNKAHNEFLNMAATTGTAGLAGYLVLIVFSAYQIYKSKNFALLAGYTSILVSNFFGFSVVPTQLQFFLFPAIAISINKTPKPEKHKNSLSVSQKLYVSLTLLFMAYAIINILRYWYADTLYAKGKAYNGIENYSQAQKFLEGAVKISPKEGLFHNDLGTAYGGIALMLKSAKKDFEAQTFADEAVSESNLAIAYSPANVNFLRNRATLFIRLSALNAKYLGPAKEALETASQKAPTDAKILYNLALVYLRSGRTEMAVATVKKAIEMKTNYKDARYFYALTLIEQNDYQEAKNQLNYILNNIDPNDENSARQLKKLGNKV